MNYPEKVMIVELECAPFSGAKPAYRWAVRHGIVGLMSDIDTGGKGEISISRASVLKMVSGSATGKSVAPSYEISNIEILKGVAGFVTRPSDKTSMLVRILLNGVCDVNGVPLLKGGSFKS